METNTLGNKKYRIPKIFRRLYEHIVNRIQLRLSSQFNASLLGWRYVLKHYPSLQFHMRKALKEGSNRRQTRNMHDPLFSCTMRPVECLVTTEKHATGKYSASFGYFGVKLSARLTDPVAVAAGKIDVRLNGKTLRELGVALRTDGLADIRYTIRRPSLELFPRRSLLSLHDAHGAPLHVDIQRFPDIQQTGDRICGAIEMDIPFGNGTLLDHLATTGPLDKKGRPRLSAAAVYERQSQMLELYNRVRRTFEEELGMKLFILYGTLLGQYRSGDFIPGDDDFDVGYVSEEHDPVAIKAETMRIMECLIAQGFIVGLNRRGRPHRVRDSHSGIEVHLDNHTVFSTGDGCTWLHPRARLPIPLDAFREVENVTLRGVDVLRPLGAQLFLAAHYGPSWHIPDPSYAHIKTSSDRQVAQYLSELCMTRSEQKEFSRRMRKKGLVDGFVASALQRPYPIEKYASRVGF